MLDGARCQVIEDWHRPEGARADRRVLELRGELAPGTRLSEGTDPFALYELPAPFPFEPSPRWIHADHRVQVVEVLDDGAIVEEFAVQGETWSALPIALTPPPPPRAGNQQSAIDAWADTLIAAAPAFPEDPATDILRRRPPRTRSGRCSHRRQGTTSMRSCGRSSTSTAATSRCRAHQAPARPTSARTSSRA